MRREAIVRRATSRPRRLSAPRFVLGDQDILALARWACVIEEHYGRPMDMEWAKDGETRRAVHRAGATRDRAIAQGSERIAILPDQIERADAFSRARALAMPWWPGAFA